MRLKVLLFFLFIIKGQALIATPAITSFSPASGPVGTLVTINGTGLNSPTAFTIGGINAIIVSNTDTQLVGMVMPGTTNGAISMSTATGTATAPLGFTVTQNQAPNSQQGSKLLTTGNTGLAQLGNAIAVSADGNTAVIGGTRDNNYKGAAWIYVRNDTAWTQQAKLVGTGAGGGQVAQGNAVAISADGNTVIIGGRGYNSYEGAAWVFIRTGSTWTQQGDKLIEVGNIGKAFLGTSVALSADGNMALIGGPGDNGGIGATFIFIRERGAWKQQGTKLVGNDYYNLARQGSSVSVSADGNTVVVGGPNDFNGTGAVWVYTRNGETWAQQGPKLVGTGNTGIAQMGTVAVSADGNTIIAGGPQDNNYKGAAWIFTRSGAIWSQQGTKLLGTGGATQDSQGSTVSLSADGNTAIIGGPYGGTLGAAWVFTRTGSIWAQHGGKLVGSGSLAKPNEGSAVAISADGTTALIGGTNDNNYKGAAWAFIHAAKQSQIIDFDPLTAVNYGWADITPTVKSTNTTLPIVLSSSDTTVAIIVPGNKIHIKTGGTVIITASQPGDTTYSDAIPVTQSLTINKKSLIIFANDAKETTGFTNPTFTVTYRGFVLGDTTSKLTTLPTVTTTATAASPPGYYPLTADGAVSPDYNITYTAGTLTVIPAQGPPQITAISPVTGPVGTLITISGTNLNHPNSINIAGKPAVVVSSTATQVVGMVMPGATSGTITLVTDSGSTTSPDSFTVTPTSYPSAQQGNKLLGNDAAGKAALGTALAISADGNTAIAGGPADNGGQGAAWIFIRNGNVWSQQGSKLVGTGNIGAAAQGGSVAISADGNTVIIGGGTDDNNQGAAWIFTRSNGVWTQQGDKLTSIGDVGRGNAVTINADGNIAVLGGWIFIRRGDTWFRQANKLQCVCGLRGQIALSADANTFSDGYYLIKRTGPYWTTAPDILERTGNAVAITADGRRIIVGEEFTAGAEEGYPYTAIQADAYDVWGDGAYFNSYFVLGGGSNLSPKVAVSADGNTTLFGARHENATLGDVFAYTLNAGRYRPQGVDLVATGAGGYVVALSADGNTGVIGSPADNSGEGGIRFFVSAAKSSQTISFAPPAAKTYGDTIAVDPAATSTNTALPITYKSSDTTVATIVANKIYPKGAGKTTITASQADGNITPVSQPFTVNKAVLTVTADNQSKQIGIDNPPLTISYTGFVFGQDTMAIAVKPTASTTATTNSLVGSYPITASGASAANYTFNYLAGILTVTDGTLPVIARFSPADISPGITVAITGANLGNTTDVSFGGIPAASFVVNSPTSITAVVGSTAASGNLTVTTTAGVAKISGISFKTGQSIGFAALPSKTYGDADFDPAATATSGLSVSYTSSDLNVAIIINNKIHIVGEGSCIITALQPGSAVYAAAQDVSKTLVVKPAVVTIKINDQTKIYSSANPLLTVGYTGFVNGDDSTRLISKPTVTTAATVSSSVGTYSINASGAAMANYSFSYVQGTLTVTQAVLTVKANNRSRLYGKTNPSFSFGYTGFVNGDDTTKLTTMAVVSTTATINSPMGTYPITVSGAVATNYTFNYIAGTLTVNPAALIITANNQTKITGQVNPPLTVNYKGFVNSDDSTKLTAMPVVTTTAITSSPVGNYPITASGAIAANYTISYFPGTLLVKPVPLPVITSFSPSTAIPGTTVTIVGINLDKVTAVKFGGTAAASFTVVSSTSITAVVGNGASGNVSVTAPAGTATLGGFTFVFDLPVDNFKLAITSATCKGSSNGSVKINAVKTLNYTATIAGNGLNTPYQFTGTATINNLTAGTYSVCITVTGQPSFKQCFDVVIAEPKDLSLYSTVDPAKNTVTLALSGGDQYNIRLNSEFYTTSGNSVTLPLKTGDNDLEVSTDKLCQGLIKKAINIGLKIIPYPDPFIDKLNLNLGKDTISSVTIEMHNLENGSLVYLKQFGSMSGVLQLDVANLKKGVYSLKLIGDGLVKIFKVFKQ